MPQQLYFLVTGVIFALIALVHLLRIVLGWPASVGGWEVPMWLSWLGLVVTGFLALSGLARWQHQYSKRRGLS